MAKIVMKKRLIHFSDKMEMMMDILIENKGLTSVSELIRVAVSEMYKRDGIEKSYKVDALSSGGSNDVEKAISKAKTKEKVIEIQEKEKEQSLLAYCENIMKGKMVDGVCYYKQYGVTVASDTDESCPASHLGGVITERDCFYPDMDSVLEHRADVKKLFNK